MLVWRTWARQQILWRVFFFFCNYVCFTLMLSSESYSFYYFPINPVPPSVESSLQSTQTARFKCSYRAHQCRKLGELERFKQHKADTFKSSSVADTWVWRPVRINCINICIYKNAISCNSLWSNKLHTVALIGTSKKHNPPDHSMLWRQQSWKQIPTGLLWLQSGRTLPWASGG
jgi:hypothetical protein